jgi:hypothetical protein
VIVRRLRLVAAIGLGLTAVGCGSGTSPAVRDAAQVKRTVQQALADLANGNGTAFCALATGPGRAKLARTLHGYSCAGVVDLVGGHLSTDTRTGLLHAKVTHVTVRGRTATVLAADITSTAGSLKGFLNDGGKPTTLVKQADGSWKISD